MKMSPAVPARKTGRPLSFDRATALHQAMLAFWRHGYETTSIADLTAAMGVTPPSLYSAFGSKEQLFREAVRLYLGDTEALARAIDEAPTSFDAARDFLNGSAKAFTGDETPQGCLLASAAASGSPAAAEVQASIAEIRRDVMEQFSARIARDIRDGMLSVETEPKALAGLIVVVTQGMSVLARDGVGRAELLEIVETALQAWPRRHP